MGFLSDLSDKFMKKSGQRIQLKVCMMGPRGVGKTTILTSIFHDSDSKLNKNGLYLIPQGITKDRIDEGKDALLNIFKEIPDESSTPLPGINATKGVTEFLFKLGLKGSDANKNKNASVDVSIEDFPGEFVNETHPEHNLVLDYIKESHVIMVAIDSVYLMELEGKYNENRNMSSYLCEKINTILSKLDEKERKIILLVPLKCEKYAVSNKLPELSKTVCEVYKPLVDNVLQNYKERIGIFVTPIQTLGGVVFNKFVCDDNNELVLDIENNNSPIPQFKFFRAIPTHAPMYMPAYCVQPLYYLISFTLNQYKYNKSQGGAVGTLFKNLFSMFSSDLEFYQACQNFVSKIKTSGDGYLSLNNPKLVNTNF